MAKTPNISITQISETPQVSFQTPKAYRGGCNHHRHPEASPATHGTSMFLRRRPLDGDASARVAEACQHIDCTCGAQRQNYDLIAEMQLRPHSGDPSFQDWRCWRKWEHTTCNTGCLTSPQFLQPSQNA